MRLFWKQSWGSVAVITLVLVITLWAKSVDDRYRAAKIQSLTAPIWEVVNTEKTSIVVQGIQGPVTKWHPYGPSETIRIWIKPVGYQQVGREKMVLIVAHPGTHQLDRYLKVKPGDELYFIYEKGNADNLGGTLPELKLWMVVPKEKLKDFPGDFRKHAEYRFQP